MTLGNAIGVMRLPGCAWQRHVRCVCVVTKEGKGEATQWRNVFLGVARRLELSPCNTVEKRISMLPHKPHATSQPSRFSHVSVWHFLGHQVPANVAPPAYQCSAGVAAEADHEMVCEKVAKMT